MTPKPRIPILGAALLAAALALPAAAQNPRLQVQSLEKLSARATEVVDVTLEGPILSLATKFMADDPEGRALVQGLKGVFVKSFEFEKEEGYSAADVEGIRVQLQSPGWSRIVGVREKKDKGLVEVYVMLDAAGKPLGLAVLAAEPRELTVVNLVGSIDLDRLSRLEGKFGIPKLSKDAKTQGATHEAKP